MESIDKIRCVVVACVMAGPLAVNAQDKATLCGAILKYGVSDTNDTLDTRSKFDLAKNALCQSSERNNSAEGGLGSKMFKASGSDVSSSTEAFCSSSYDEARSSEKFQSAVKTASKTITNAWSECIRNNLGGLSHYIDPVDPTTFDYKIFFTPDGPPYEVEIENWNIHGGHCDVELKSGRMIGNGGMSLSCGRSDATTMVSISVNTKNGSGMANIGVVHLLPFHENTPQPLPVAPPPLPKPPPLPSLGIADQLQRGVRCSVIFSAPYRNGCLGHSKDLARNSTYVLTFVGDQSGGNWTTSGHICNTPHNTTATRNDKNLPKGSKLNLWGAIFTFDAKGNVRDPADSNVTGTLSCPAKP